MRMSHTVLLSKCRYVPRRPVCSEASLCVPRRACLSRGGYVCPEAGLFILKRASRSRGGPVCPEAGMHVPRRACLSQGGPFYPEAGLSVPRQACLSRSGTIPHDFRCGRSPWPRQMGPCSRTIETQSVPHQLRQNSGSSLAINWPITRDCLCGRSPCPRQMGPCSSTMEPVEKRRLRQPVASMYRSPKAARPVEAEACVVRQSVSKTVSKTVSQ